MFEQAQKLHIRLHQFENHPCGAAGVEGSLVLTKSGSTRALKEKCILQHFNQYNEKRGILLWSSSIQLPLDAQRPRTHFREKVLHLPWVNHV